MNYQNPKQLSILVSLLLISFFAAVVYLTYFVFHLQVFYVYTITLILVFCFSYLVYRYFMEKFIYERIKLLYKTIYVLKAPKKEKERFFNKKDLIEDVNEKIIKWAENKKEEIEQLKKSDFFKRIYWRYFP